MTAPRLFSVPAFRFAVDTAIGKWSRFATGGPKSKDGTDMMFDATSFGEMVDNAARRGDPIAICADHSSAYPETKDAPALGFFHALAVVAAGTVIKHWALDGKPAPDASGMEDGLYARLGEVTPRGADPLHGLANYRCLSPMFSDKGTDETGAAIGYALFDVAAVNTPFQAGTSIQFHAAPSTMGIRADVTESGGMVAVELAITGGAEPGRDWDRRANAISTVVARLRQDGHYAGGGTQDIWTDAPRARVADLLRNHGIQMSQAPVATTTTLAAGDSFKRGDRVAIQSGRDAGAHGTVIDYEGQNPIVRLDDGRLRIVDEAEIEFYSRTAGRATTMGKAEDAVADRLGNEASTAEQHARQGNGYDPRRWYAAAEARERFAEAAQRAGWTQDAAAARDDAKRNRERADSLAKITKDGSGVSDAASGRGRGVLPGIASRTIAGATAMGKPITGTGDYRIGSVLRSRGNSAVEVLEMPSIANGSVVKVKKDNGTVTDYWPDEFVRNQWTVDTFSAASTTVKRGTSMARYPLDQYDVRAGSTIYKDGERYTVSMVSDSSITAKDASGHMIVIYEQDFKDWDVSNYSRGMSHTMAYNRDLAIAIAKEVETHNAYVRAQQDFAAYDYKDPVRRQAMDKAEAVWRAAKAHRDELRSQAGMSQRAPGWTPGSTQYRMATSGARRFNFGGPMSEQEMAAHFGFEPDDDAEKKMAKVMAKMAAMEAIAPPDDEEEKEKAAMAGDLGVPAKMSAIRAAAVPMSKYTALEQRLAAVEAERAAEKQRTVDAQVSDLADRAVKCGYPVEQRESFMKFARADFEGAAKFTETLPGARAMQRLTGGGAPLTSPARASAAPAVASRYEVRGATFSRLSKERAAKDKIPLAQAQRLVAAENPDAAREALALE